MKRWLASPSDGLEQRIRRDEAGAFDALYQTYGSRVLGFAVRLSGNQAEAEDLVQDVFLAAYDARAEFRGRSRLLTWLLGIAVRRWRDRCRYHARRPVDSGRDELLADRTDGARVETQVIESLALDEALMSLELPFRVAVLLVHSHGLSYREASDALGEPVGTVKWRVFEGTRRLRRHLEAVDTETRSLELRNSGSMPIGAKR